MLKQLVKKQMAEIFRSYLYDAKKSQKRAKGTVILYFALFVFLMVGVLGALTTYSALMVECLLFARSDRQGLVPAYLAVTLVGGLALVWLGARLAGLLRGSAW